MPSITVSCHQPADLPIYEIATREAYYEVLEPIQVALKKCEFIQYLTSPQTASSEAFDALCQELAKDPTNTQPPITKNHLIAVVLQNSLACLEKA